MEKQNNILKFVQHININFKNKNLLYQAFVHRSYLNENSDFELDQNERLEFLGDAVLELVVSQYLYQKYPKEPEGQLTAWRSALVKGEMISKIASDLEFNNLLFLSKGEEQSHGKSRQLILANAFEAVIGAIYLDQGFDAAKKFIEKYLLVNLERVIKQKLYQDSKSSLQELSQEKTGITPIYKVLSETGPDHNKIFKIAVYIKEKQIGAGNGSSKQAAEQDAAQNALENWQAV